MALLRSLLTGVSGLRSQQTAIDVIGDNIANVSTNGYKKARVNFSTLISQTMKFGSAPQGFLGGQNPAQVGLGTQVAAVQKMWTQGPLRATGLATDLAIDDGASARTFFVLTDYAGRDVYTRNGAFGLNRNNQLYDSSSGYFVQGWMADINSTIERPDGVVDFELNAGGDLQALRIDVGNLVIAEETTRTDWLGNLNGGGSVADDASVLESEALFDGSSGSLVPAGESTLLQNLVRSTDGTTAGNAIDLGMDLGSIITVKASIGGSTVNREFVVGDPPPTGGTTLGDMRDWMQGALGINRSDAPGEEMISAQRLDQLTGESITGTLDQVGATGYTTLTLGGAPFQIVEDASVAAAVAGTTTIGGLQIFNAAGIDLTGGGAGMIVTGTGPGGEITSGDLQAALNSFAAGYNLPSQFTVSGDTTNGFSITNMQGNSFSSTDAGSTPIFAGPLTIGVAAGQVMANSALGVAQQPLLQAGDSITFDNFSPLMAAQVMQAVAPGLGNGSQQFEIGATAAETASNLATAINLNPALSGLVTASVVGNQIQLTARQPGVDGNFTVSSTTTAAGAVIDSTVGIETMEAQVGDTFDVSSDGNAVTSAAAFKMRTTAFANLGVVATDATGTAGLQFQVAISNMANSPIQITLTDTDTFADTQALATAIAAAINADANVIAAGVDNFSVGSFDNATGDFTIASSDNANFTVSGTSVDSDDYGQIFTQAATSTSNGVKVQIVPASGSANVGFTAVEEGVTPAATAKNIAAALNSSVYVNPPLSVSALGTFVRITDASTIGEGQGNAVSSGSIVQNATANWTVETGNTLIGAGASADTFVRPNASDYVDGVADGTIIDDEMDFISAGVQVGDFIRFSTGAASGLIAKITQVGYVNDPANPGNLLANPHAIQFEVQNTDSLPSFSVPSAYTIHEAASVDIGVNSNLAAANPPLGLDTATGSGSLRISGHVGTAHRISNIDLNVSNRYGTQSILANFTSINDAAGESLRTSTTVYDSLGIGRRVDMTFWLESKSNSGTTWHWQATAQDNNVTPGLDVDTVVGGGTVKFDTNGRYLADSGNTVMIQLDDFGVDEPVNFTLDFTELSGFASQITPDGSSTNPSEVFLFDQDGYEAGTLADFSIGTDGRITGLFDNGLSRTLGQIATARFTNPEGLTSLGENYYREDVNSGDPIVGVAGSGGRGVVRSGFLEESNVELAEQFTDLIQAQRAYQANARTISTSSQLLQELINLI